MTRRTYRGYHLCPVLNDETGKVDYWDVHDPEDPRCEGDPIGELLATLADAQQFVNALRRDDALIRAFDRLRV